MARVPGSRFRGAPRARGFCSDLRNGKREMSFLGAWSNGKASVSKTEDRGSIPRASGNLMACISTDRLPGYEPGDGGSTPSMPTISGCGAVDSAVGSEPEGRWFESIRPETSRPEAQLEEQRSSKSLDPGSNPGGSTFMVEVAQMVRVSACDAGGCGVGSRPLPHIRPVAKSERHLPAKQTMRGFDSRLDVHHRLRSIVAMPTPFKRGSGVRFPTEAPFGLRSKRLALEALLAKHRILTPGSAVRFRAGAPSFCGVF